MRLLWALPALLSVSNVMLTQAYAKPEQLFQIGENRELGNDKSKIASMFLFWGDYEQEFMREPALDEARSKIEQGPFPNKSQKVQDHNLRIRLSITEAGAVTECKMVEPSKVASINDHTCKHLSQHAIFHPALDMQGAPVAVTGEFHVYYYINIFDLKKPPKLIPPPAAPINHRPNQKDTSPVNEIVAADLGLTADLIAKHKISWIVLSVDVDASGTASRCMFQTPTYDNALDVSICEKVMRQKFNAAINYDGEPTSSYYSLVLHFEQAG
jgi:hypothetical protein